MRDRLPLRFSNSLFMLQRRDVFLKSQCKNTCSALTAYEGQLQSCNKNALNNSSDRHTTSFFFFYLLGQLLHIYKVNRTTDHGEIIIQKSKVIFCWKIVVYETFFFFSPVQQTALL